MRARALAFVILVPCLAASARAQPAPDPAAKPAPSQEDRERANALMDEGDEKVEKGDLLGAAAAYERAHRIMRVPTTGIELARTLDKLGKLLPALSVAREVVQMPAADGEPKPFTEAREQARALLSDLEARVPTLSITVKVAAPDTPAEITLDGRELTKDELAAPLVLAPGRYRVAASAGGHAPTSVEVVLKERDRGQVALALAKAAPPPPPPKPLPPPPPSLSPLVPAGFTIAGVGAIAGAITGALAISSVNAANNLCGEKGCPDQTTLDRARAGHETGDALAVASDVSFVLAIGGAVMGIYGISVSLSPAPAQPAPAKPAASVLFGPGTAAFRTTF